MGAAPGSICPRFFPFFAFFFPHQEEWRQPHQARFALVFFPCFFHVRRSGVRRIRPDLPLFFPLFFHVRRSGVSRIRPGLPLFFSFFFHVRRSAGGRTRPGLPLFFSFFSTSGGVLGAASGPICARFFMSGGVGRRRQLCRVGGPSGDCSLSSWGITCILLRGRMEGASQACFFFKRLHHLAT